MPERWMDSFGNAFARGLNGFTESALSSYADHFSNVHPHPIVVGNSSIDNKSWHQDLDRQKFFPGMSTQPSSAESEAFMAQTTPFLPSVSGNCQLQPAAEVRPLPYLLPQYQHPQLEEAEIWMQDILDSTPSISNVPELPSMSQINAALDEIPPLDLSCPISLPELQPHEEAVRNSEDESVSHHATDSSEAVSITDYMPSYGDVSFVSPTRDSLKARGSRQSQKGSKSKGKKVQETHVKRERQRRDQMSINLSTLSCLLPPPSPANGNRRDKTSIIEDTTHYLKALQIKVEELKKSLAELKLERESRRARALMETVELGNPALARSSRQARLVEFLIQVEGQAVVSLEKCACRPDFMSSSMKVLELLNLDVCRYTITKAFDHTICVIFAKPRLSSQAPPSAAVLSAFRAALQVSIMKKEGHDPSPPAPTCTGYSGSSCGRQNKGEEKDS